MGLGTVVIDEIVLPIKKLTLEDGKFAARVEVEPETWKGLAGGRRGYALFGGDGELVLRGYMEITPIPADQKPVTAVTFTLRFAPDGKLTASGETGIPIIA